MRDLLPASWKQAGCSVMTRTKSVTAFCTGKEPLAGSVDELTVLYITYMS